MSDMHKRPVEWPVWLKEGRIITRNADGSTTAWTEEDAFVLHKRLGTILDSLGIKTLADAMRSDAR